jgi:hypothetical protein
MDLSKNPGNEHNRKLVEKHIELVTAEIKSREGFNEVFDEDMNVRTAE